jgi:P-type Ca2+ transporter type 2C
MQRCRVIRGGKEAIIATEELMVGDILKLSENENIPADGILIEGNVRVEESDINGETRLALKLAPSSYQEN